MNPKTIQFILNMIAFTAIFLFVMWVSIIWIYNPSLTQMQLLRNTWQGFVLMLALALPAIVYDVSRKQDKRK